MTLARKIGIPTALVDNAWRRRTRSSRLSASCATARSARSSGSSSDTGPRSDFSSTSSDAAPGVRRRARRRRIQAKTKSETRRRKSRREQRTRRRQETQKESRRKGGKGGKGETKKKTRGTSPRTIPSTTIRLRTTRRVDDDDGPGPSALRKAALNQLFAAVSRDDVATCVDALLHVAFVVATKTALAKETTTTRGTNEGTQAARTRPHLTTSLTRPHLTRPHSTRLHSTTRRSLTLTETSTRVRPASSSTSASSSARLGDGGESIAKTVDARARGTGASRGGRRAGVARAGRRRDAGVPRAQDEGARSSAAAAATRVFARAPRKSPPPRGKIRCSRGWWRGGRRWRGIFCGARVGGGDADGGADEASRRVTRRAGRGAKISSEDGSTAPRRRGRPRGTRLVRARGLAKGTRGTRKATTTTFLRAARRATKHTANSAAAETSGPGPVRAGAFALVAIGHRAPSETSPRISGATRTPRGSTRAPRSASPSEKPPRLRRATKASPARTTSRLICCGGIGRRRGFLPRWSDSDWPSRA